MSYLSSDSNVQERQLEVQRLVIPFTITGNATAADVAITCDEGSIVYFETEGVDQITAALADGETATYTAAADDSAGQFNVLVKVQQPVRKIMNMMMIGRDSGLVEVAKLGSATGLTSESNIMISCDTAKDLATAVTLNACLVVEYIVQQ